MFEPIKVQMMRTIYKHCVGNVIRAKKIEFENNLLPRKT